jgi:hypothetical protein
MGGLRALAWLVLPLLLLLLPVLLPPLAIQLTTVASWAAAFLDHTLGPSPTATTWDFIVVSAVQCIAVQVQCVGGGWQCWERRGRPVSRGRP